MTKLKSETIRYDQLDGDSGNLLDDLKVWVENLLILVCQHNFCVFACTHVSAATK